MRSMEVLGLEIKRFLARDARDTADRAAMQAAGYRLPTLAEMESGTFAPQGHAALARKHQQRKRAGQLIRLQR